MAKGSIIIGAGRGMSFVHWLTRDLQRPISAIVEVNRSAHAQIRRRLQEWGLSHIAIHDSVDGAFQAIPRSEADIAFVMTPNRTHLEVMRKALAADCHVFLEKPLATTPKDVLEIVRLASTTDRTVQVGFVLRYARFYRKIKEIVDSGALGQLVQIQMNERLGMDGGFARARWRSTLENTGGFLNEKCSHDLDLLCWFKEGQSQVRDVFSVGGRHFMAERDTPTTCSACRLRKCPWRAPKAQCVFHSSCELMDHQSTSMRFEDGTEGMFSYATFSPVPGRDIRIFGTDGYLEGHLEASQLRFKHYWDSEDLHTIELGGGVDHHGGGDTRIVAEFLDCVDRHVQPMSSVLDGARASLLAFAADESVRTGKAVAFAPTVRRLAAAGRKLATTLPTLAGRGFDQNLVVRGSRVRNGFEFMVGNPTDWPVEVRLRFNAGAAKFLRDRSAGDKLPISKDKLSLTLSGHERKSLRLPGADGKLLGAKATVACENADELKQFALEKMNIYRRIANDTDMLEKIAAFIQSDQSPAMLRKQARAVVTAAKKGDVLTIANLTGGYVMRRLEDCLRMILKARTGQARRPVRFFIACGSAMPFEDRSGRVWQAPQPWMEGLMPWGYIDGQQCEWMDVRIQGTNTPRLYQSDWHNLTGYRFKVPNGRYAVRLHFAETWFNKIGQRRFDVRIQGEPVLESLDVLKETGGKFRAMVKDFTARVKDGILAIDFSPSHDYPGHATMINAIEVTEHHN